MDKKEMKFNNVIELFPHPSIEKQFKKSSPRRCHEDGRHIPLGETISITVENFLAEIIYCADMLENCEEQKYLIKLCALQVWEKI